MFARVKKTGQYQYLQLVQNRREGKKTIQRVVATLGRVEELQQKGDIESLVRSLSRFSETVLMILSGKSVVNRTDKLDWPGLDLRAPVAGAEDRKDHRTSSGGSQVRVRCRTGHLSDGSAQALCLGLGPLL